MSTLNDKQLEAVKTVEGPLLILAGAGSGKTTVLINRMAYMIKECGIAPWNILTITFTNKAANEIKNRLEIALGEEGMDVWASTFHSMCVRILRRDGEQMGYRSGFAIYDAADQLTLMKECLKELNYSDKDFPPKSMLAIISSAKDQLVTPEAFLSVYGSDYRMQKISNIYTLYQKKLQKNNAVDFDDLIMQTVFLFESHPDVLAYYQKKCRYIMVDEYQDTSHSQYRLISNLAKEHHNICVVGDDDQSIYKFRGADISNILDFEKQFQNAKVIKLEQNYRSTSPILDAANAVIRHNTGRKDKKRWTEKTQGTVTQLYYARNEHDEAFHIADTVQELVRQGKSYKDIAILFRMNAQSRVIEETLLNNAVPYRLLSGIRFYERKEVKDIVAYLRLVQNTADDVSLMRIINEPKRGIGKTTTDKLSAFAAQNGISMFDVIRNIVQFPDLRSAAEKLIAFMKMIESFREAAETLTVSQLTTKIMEESQYLPALKAENTVEAATRIENLQEFMTVILEFEKTVENGTLSEFLEGVALVSDIDNYDEEQDAVVLMTLHSAKGLEFPVVFLCGMEEGVFPSQRAIFENDIEEERRLCYVGITRAKERLFLSAANARTIFGTTSYNRISRFIEEIPPDLLQETGRKQVSFVEEKPKTEYFTTVFAKKPAKPPAVNIDYRPGDRVQHARFGDGTILSVEPMGNDAKLSIAFDTVGTKNLMAVLAKLKKL